ncbi:MAG: UvrD-helicase domain-containing protein [Burkholderiaceae bacterium]
MSAPHGPAYEHNGAHVAREAFYAIACDPKRNVAVEACAGAGKTWMLVSRILRALLEGAPPQEILAITFTRKAAGEMRERLQEWLAAFARKPLPELERELALRGVPAHELAQAAPRLQALYAQVLESGRPVQVRTFHGWFAALLRTAPLAVLERLGLPAGYELLEDDSQATRRVWRRFHALLAKDESACGDFKAVVARYGRFQAQKALEGTLARRIEFTLADGAGRIEGSVKRFSEQFTEFAGLDTPDEMLTTNRDHRQKLRDAAVALGRAAQPSFSAKGVELEQALSAGDFEGAFAALLTQKGEARKFSDKLAGIESVRIAQDLALRLIAARHQHEAWLYQQRMARLARILLAEYAAVKREHGWVDMNDVEQAALVLLGDAELGGWIQERLDARVSHLLVDEFQDTNPLQWQALSAWLSGYAGAGNAPSVFIVGDPKQSIYRFRRAEPKVFKAAQAFIRDGLQGHLLSCDHTRRNAPAVIDAVNSVMGAAQAAGEYEGFRAHTTESKDEGRVRQLPQVPRGTEEEVLPAEAYLSWRDSLVTPREVPEETLRTLECRQAAAFVAQRIAEGMASDEVMVLARKRDRLAVMQDELRALHVATQQPEKNELGEAPEVQDIVALLDALVSPQHELSLARALRSPVFGVPDEALVALASAQRAAREAKESSSWFSLLAGDALHPALAGIGAKLRQWQGWLAAVPPHDALARIYEDGDVPARFAAAAPPPLRAAVLANVNAVLGASLTVDGARYATPYGFVRALRQGGIKAPASTASAAVRLLTIHGAKGLEADLVLMLDTDGPPARAESMGVLVDWPGEEMAPRRFVFLASESNPPACTVEALEAERTARQREELNALYVAMTRARHEILVSSVQPHRGQEMSWWQRISPLAASVEAPAPRVMQDTPAKEFMLPVLPPLAAPPRAFAPPASPDSEESRVGQAMHRLLERAPLDGGEFPEAEVRAAARQFELDEAQGRRALDMARRIRAGAGGWAWDSRVIAWQGNEVEMLVDGKVLRLDRLVRTAGGEWWLLDYKSASRPGEKPELQAQMQGYRAALQAIYPNETVRAAFLTGQGEVVEIE